jgi:hypothetical protein
LKRDEEIIVLQQSSSLRFGNDLTPGSSPAEPLTPGAVPQARTSANGSPHAQ